MSQTRELPGGGGTETLSRHNLKAHWWLPVTERVQREVAAKKHKETSGVMEMFYISLVVVVT